jgi:hypothetical protein
VAVDYYGLIAGAVSKHTGDRRAFFEHVRTIFAEKLQHHDPLLSEAEMARERQAFEAAICRVEHELSSIQTQAPEGRTNLQPPVNPATNDPIDRPQPEQSSELIAHAKEELGPRVTVKGIFISQGPILLGITFIAGMIFLALIYVRGLAWVSENVIEYLVPSAVIAVEFCLFILLPLAIIRTTRFISAFGFFGAAYLFGLTTWILGFLATLRYWGLGGVFIGLFLGIIGVVPLGIVASAFHSDWSAAVILIIGLLVTYGARAVALALAAKS